MFTDLADYEAKRQSLIDENNKYRFDCESQRRRSGLEDEANRLLSQLKLVEHKSIWKVDDDASVHRYMPFAMSKERSMQSQLFKLLKKMPKAGHLHCHADASCSSAFLYQEALRQPSLVMRCSRHLSEDDFVLDRKHLKTPLLISFDYNKTVSANVSSLFEESYDRSWLEVGAVRAHCPVGQDAFDSMVMAHLSLPAHSYSDTSQEVWKHFGEYFGTAAGLFHHPETFVAYFRETIRASVEDGIRYIELRKAFLDIDDPLTPAEQMRILSQCVKEAKEYYGPEKFWGLRVIYVAIRFVKGMQVEAAPGFECQHDMEYFMKQCMDLKAIFPDLICGFDMAAHEDTGITHRKYIPDLLWFREECLKRGLDIPFCFHAGETNADGGEIVENLVDAVLLGTKRIGHGYALVMQPKLMDICKEKGILVESCPISNEVLKYTPSMLNHPLSIMLAHGIPVTLNNDDCACFKNEGLTHDFYHFYNHTSAFDLISLKQLISNSITYSFMTEQEKSLAHEIFSQQWQEFLQLIIQTLKM